MYGWGAVEPIVAQGYAAAAQALQDEEVLSITISLNSGMAPSMSEFFNNELLSDITICSQDGERFKCHKLVLVRWSTPLRRMLTGDMREAHESCITLHGVDSDVLGAFLRFMYTCSCSIATEKLVGLTAMADQYDVTLLQQLCMDAIRSHATNHRCCCMFYKAAKEVQQTDIQQLAWEHLASNLSSLVRQHDVFVQLELEDVLLLCGRSSPPQGRPRSTLDTGPSSSRGRAAVTGAACAPSTDAEEVLQQARAQDSMAIGHGVAEDFNRHHVSAASTSLGTGACTDLAGSRPSRPEYLLFLALMAWLDHKPDRQQYTQQLLECVSFTRMTNYELSQVRHHPQVECNNQLKNMLLDAYAYRCLQSSQHPVYHMMPSSATLIERRLQQVPQQVHQQRQEQRAEQPAHGQAYGQQQQAP